MEPLTEVWRTEDRLHTDDATISRLCDLASRDPAIRDVIDDLHPAPAGNGSVWASGIAHGGRTPALLKLGARDNERQWMTSIDAVTEDVVPRVFGSGELRGVGWLVLERCEFALDRSLSTHVAAVVESSARFQHAAMAVSAGAFRMDLDWLRENLSGAQTLGCPGDLRQALADAEKSWAFVSAQCGLTANHGDVHFGNVVARRADGPALLVDPMLGWVDIQDVIHDFARERRAFGLPTRDQLEQVERLVLGWVAAYWWRIAPWRHDNAAWRAKVEHWIQALRW